MNKLNHVAIIMDGNGRWGLKKKGSRNYGHLKGIKTVENIISASVKNNISFFIGQTTSVIVALEKNLNVIHICNNPNFDMYNSKLWNNLKVAKISNNSFEYKLLKKNSFLNFVNNSKSKIIKSYECD